VNWDNEYVLVLGDFNARTGTIQYVEEDFEYTINNSMADFMDALSIPHDRMSCDIIVNNFGTAMIDFCMSQNLLIVNGRVGDDAGIGKPTCKGVSVVDYVVASPALFSHITSFSVADFNECLSDVHCPLILSLAFHDTVVSKTPGESVSDTFENNTYNLCKPVWLPQNKDIFVARLDEKRIEDLSIILNRLLTNVDGVLQRKVNDVANEVVEILLLAAKNSDMVKPSKKRVNKFTAKKKLNTPWFDSECRKYRNEWVRTKRKVRRTQQGNTVDNNRKQAYKKYKYVLNKKYNMYRRNMHATIRNMRRPQKILDFFE
jgi:hypothetical protein